MPLAPGDWICRACWTSNRPGDRLCRRCRTPRGFDPDATVQQDVVTIVRGDDALPPLLTGLPSAFLRVSAYLGMLQMVPAVLASVLLVLFGGLDTPPGWPVPPAVLLIGGLVIGGFLVYLQFAAARAISDRRRWGYLAGIAFTAPFAVGGTAGQSIIAGQGGDLSWLVLILWIEIALYGLVALLCLLALAASLLSTSTGMATPAEATVEAQADAGDRIEDPRGDS